MKKKRISIFVGLIFMAIMSLWILSDGKVEDAIVIDQVFQNPDPNINQSSTLQEEKSSTTNSNSSLIQSSDKIGSIKIIGTKIDYPIVQGVDNEYYLDHSTDHKKDEQGSIFMDYRNTGDERKLLIYGHNSETITTALFHDLEKYLNQKFYQKYSTIDIVLNDEKSTWQIFSVMIVEDGDYRHTKITFNDSEWIEHLNWMKNNSLYDTGVSAFLEDQIITLQTCYYSPKDSYLIVNAKKIK